MGNVSTLAIEKGSIDTIKKTRQRLYKKWSKYIISSMWYWCKDKIRKYTGIGRSCQRSNITKYNQQIIIDGVKNL